MIQTFIPILSYYMLKDKTIDIDFHDSSFLYKLDLDTILIDEVTGFTEKKFEMIPGTNKLHIHIAGIDASFQINGDLKLLSLIPFTATGVTVKGASIDFVVESISETDNIHWKLVDSSKFHFDSLKINMKNKVL